METNSNNVRLAAVLALANIFGEAVICAPETLTVLARSVGLSESAFLWHLETNVKVRDYFAETIRKVAASPQGQQVLAEYRQQA